MKKLILALILASVAGIVIWKTTNRPATTPSQTVATSISGKPVFYLFHDPADQDEGCRLIYSFVEVKRPDVKSEMSIVDKYQVRVLPTILVVDSTGAVKERFEGEEKKTVAQLEEMMARLKTSLQ